MIIERISERRHLIVDDRMLDWIAARIQGGDASGWHGSARAVGVTLDDNIVAGLALRMVAPGDAELAIAAETPRWFTRETFARMMQWPFLQLDCHRVTARSAASNTRAIRFNERVGFKHEGLIREGWPGRGDCVLMGLLRSEAPDWMLPRRDIARTLELA